MYNISEFYTSNRKKGKFKKKILQQSPHSTLLETPICSQLVSPKAEAASLLPTNQEPTVYY